ncbi:hypothetical protein J4232_04040 [Candidatus Woesearchaeota archaeon]|nr:hypothetical protein [Candidatus Woesearchaeota archaeon]
MGTQTEPRLSTIEMVRKAIRDNDRKYSIYQLWRLLPKKMMYQTYKTSIAHLIKNKEITFDNSKKITMIRRIDETGNLDSKKQISRKDIIYNLSCYGYDLISVEKIKKANRIEIEELIMIILIQYPQARFIEAIPTILLKNDINQFELYRKSYDYGLINKIGFLLEIASKIAKKKKIGFEQYSNLLQQFRKMKSSETIYFTTLTNVKLLEKNIPFIMRQWNLLGRFSLEDFYKEEYL